jgi:uncharacterized membrane protein
MFHALLVHFPIVLLLLATATYWIRVFRPSVGTAQIPLVLYVLGVVSMILAVISGNLAEF